MRIEKCPLCGKPGTIVRVYRKIKDKKFGPYPQVEHYAGYNPKTKTRRIRKCYIRTKRISPAEKERILALLKKHSA